MPNSPSVRCRLCERSHKPRYLCDPAKQVLDALYERGMSFNMPSLEFPEPVPASEIGMALGPGDTLLRQVVVQAATVPFAGVARSAVIFTGRDMQGQPLPRWIYPGDAEDMARLAGLVREMTDLATRAAAQARGE